MKPSKSTTLGIGGSAMRRRVLTLATTLMVIAAPVCAQDVQDAADRSMVVDNTAKGIPNGAVLLTAIPGASALALPIRTTGYFAGGVSTPGGPNSFEGANLGSLGLGSEKRCPLVNGYRAETTYTPGQPFRVRNCGLINNFWVGVRVYGMICAADSPADCQDLRDPPDNPEQYEAGGYVALLKPGPECSPGRWPTEELRRAGAPAYAEWCDFGVKVP